jgi:hypothetical protein
VCKFEIPLGWPVEPLVYSINSGSSASMGSGGQYGRCLDMTSCHQTSLGALLVLSTGKRNSLVAGPFNNYNCLNSWTLCYSFIHNLFQVDSATTTFTLIGSDYKLALCI